MLGFCPPNKKLKTEYGAVITSRSSDAESDFACTKRKTVRQRPKTATPISAQTSFLDLNDDCLYTIFNLTRVSLFDFYSLSQACTRLNEIGSGIFERKIKICDFSHITDRNAEMVIGVLKNFRSVISELRLCMRNISCSNSSAIIDSIIRYCKELKSLTIKWYRVPDNPNDFGKVGLLFKNLEKLQLENVYIVDDSYEVIKTAGRSFTYLFADCQSMISLKVDDCHNLEQTIFESSFPQLEHFDYKSGFYRKYNNFKDFILRHRNLKSFRSDTKDDDYLEILAAGCKNLTNLKICLGLRPLFVEHTAPNSSLYDSVKSLANFQNLKELKVGYAGYDGATKLIEVLPQLAQSLKSFHVERFCRYVDLIPAVVQLKNLRIFRLRYSDTIDISRIGELTELVELSLIDVKVQHVNLIRMVSGLVSLKKLKFYVNDFNITNELYAKLLDVLKQRKRECQHLEMYCRVAIDFRGELCQPMLEMKC